jgi:hypothetical protein
VTDTPHRTDIPEPEYFVTVPGEFGVYFDGTDLAMSRDPNDQVAAAVHDAWAAADIARNGLGERRTIQGTRAVLERIRQDACALLEESKRGDFPSTPYERRGCRKAIDLITAVLSRYDNTDTPTS